MCSAYGLSQLQTLIMTADFSATNGTKEEEKVPQTNVDAEDEDDDLEEDGVAEAAGAAGER